MAGLFSLSILAFCTSCLFSSLANDQQPPPCTYPNPPTPENLIAAEERCRSAPEQFHSPSALFNWGRMVDSLCDMGRKKEPHISHEKAIERYKAAVQKAGGVHKESMNNIGRVLTFSLNRLAEGEAVLRQAFEAVGAWFSPVRSNLAKNLIRQERIGEALEVYEIAKKQNASLTAGEEFEAGTLMPTNYESMEDQTKWLRRYLSRLEDLKKKPNLQLRDPFKEITFKNAPGYYLLAYLQFNIAPLVNLLARVYEKATPSLRYVANGLESIPWEKEEEEEDEEEEEGGMAAGQFVNWQPQWRWAEPPSKVDPSTGGKRKIRVGVLSFFFRFHASGRMASGVFPHLDPTKFHLTVFFAREPKHGSLLNSNDPISTTFRKRADESVDLPMVSLQHAREEIAKRKLDVLVYAALGMEPFSWFLAFSRLAPVQIATHGHASTTGIQKSLDFYATYRGFEAFDGQSRYTERLLTHQGMVKYPRRNIFSPQVHGRESIGLPESGPLLICLQTPFKNTPTFDRVWKALLIAIPDATVVFKEVEPPALKERFRKRFEAALGEDLYKRVVWARGLDNQKWFDIMRVATVFVDSYPFGGYTTSLEALDVGLPIVTLESPGMMGRCSGGFLRAVGVGEETVAVDADDLIVKVRALATNSTLRSEVSNRILQNLGALHDDDTSVRGWEKTFEETFEAVERSRKQTGPERVGPNITWIHEWEERVPYAGEEVDVHHQRVWHKKLKKQVKQMGTQLEAEHLLQLTGRGWDTSGLCSAETEAESADGNTEEADRSGVCREPGSNPEAKNVARAGQARGHRGDHDEL